jgi:putative ABC transport system ATP-binding protein
MAAIVAGTRRGFPRQLPRRVATAASRAHFHRPGLILADDQRHLSDTSADVELFPVRVREAGAAVLLVTHSHVAAAVADRTLLLTPQGLITRHER